MKRLFSIATQMNVNYRCGSTLLFFWWLILADTTGKLTLALSSPFDGLNASGSAFPPSEDVLSPSQTLYLVSLLPYPADGQSDEAGGSVVELVWNQGPGVYLAGELAVELINNESDILSGYTLELIRGDGGCQVVSTTTVEFTKTLFYNGGRHALGMMGPACSAAGLFVSKAISTNEKDISLVSLHLGGSPLFARRSYYPYSFSMLAHPHILALSLVELMKFNDWRNVIVLYDESQILFTTLLEHFQQVIGEDAHIPVASLIYDNYIPFNDISKSEKRIILLLVGSNLLSRMLCVSFSQGFTYPRYQWIFASAVLDELTSVSTFYEGMPVTCQLEDLLENAKESIFIQYQLKPLDQTKHTYFGLNYSQFLQRYEDHVNNYNYHTNSSILPSEWGTAYFDAMWAMALALNYSIDELRSQNIEIAEFMYGQNHITDLIRKHLLQLSFEGVSGKVHFNNTSGFVRRGIDIKQLKEGKLKPMMVFNGTHLQQTGTGFETIEDNFDNYGTFSEVPVWVTVPFILITLLLATLLIVLHCYNIALRHTASVKASSLKILHVAYVGCYLTTIVIIFDSIATFLDNHRKRKCQLEQVSFSVLYFAMTLIFSTIFVRTWRLYRIFVHFIDPGVFISNKALFLFIFLCLTFELPMIVGWYITDPIQPTIIKNFDLKQRRIYCTSETFITWFLVLLAYNAILLLVSCYFALRCNKISQKDFKSNSILNLAYVLTIELTVGISIYILIPRSHNPLPEYVIKNMTLLLYVASCCLMLFLPPIFTDKRRRSVYRSMYRTQSSFMSTKSYL